MSYYSSTPSRVRTSYRSRKEKKSNVDDADRAVPGYPSQVSYYPGEAQIATSPQYVRWNNGSYVLKSDNDPPAGYYTGAYSITSPNTDTAEYYTSTYSAPSPAADADAEGLYADLDSLSLQHDTSLAGDYRDPAYHTQSSYSQYAPSATTSDYPEHEISTRTGTLESYPSTDYSKKKKPYSAVKVLLVHWEEDGDLPGCGHEVYELEKIFRNNFEFQTEIFAITDDDAGQAKRHIRNFFSKAGRSELLILYYGGHATKYPFSLCRYGNLSLIPFVKCGG